MSIMKCMNCGAKAAMRMRQHRLSLCKEHYLEWFVAQTDRFITKYKMFKPHERILVAVSGGKDSLGIWDVLWRLGYQVDGLYINLGIDGGINYSSESEQYNQAFIESRDLSLAVVDMKSDYAATIPDLARNTLRGRQKPCSACGLVKRHIMNQYCQDHGYDVLVTGHNLDDEASVLFSNVFNWNSDLLLRQAPVLPDSNGLSRKAKPFCRFAERETAAYAILRGIEYHYEECPYSVESTSLYYKSILNQIEETQPGAKLRFYSGFLKARKTGLFNKSVETNMPADEGQRCPNCGQPTLINGLCAFCRLFVQQSENRPIRRKKKH